MEEEEEDRCLLRANFGAYCGPLFPSGPPKSELELYTVVGFIPCRWGLVISNEFLCVAGVVQRPCKDVARGHRL